MLNTLRSWSGAIEIDGTYYDNVDACGIAFNNVSTISSIRLLAKRKTAPESIGDAGISISNTQVYKITVKQYMTKPSSPSFDFMSQWNDNNPMPLRTMVGTIEKETRGMVYMKLRGDTDGNPVQHCMKCGKPITNPVSQFFGLGPECGKHNYVNPFESDEELKSVVENYRKSYLNNIVWEGWIIKSAIISQEEYNEG